MIFYFTGTGNSLYAARKLAENVGDTELYSMVNPHAPEQIGGQNNRIGFVFPAYYGNLPRIVKKFIDGLNIHPETYIFGIVTMGGGFGAGSVAALEKAVSEKGLQLRYGRGLLMPANYIVNYNPMFLGRANKVDSAIKRISDDIKAQKSEIKKINFTADNLYKNIEWLDGEFFAESQCRGCGQCEKICPVGNIKLADKKPVWEHHCEHCMACIQWCPEKAIQYGAKTKKRGRYHHPHVALSDMINR
jgi:ferredoxin/flavodoxin